VDRARWVGLADFLGQPCELPHGWAAGVGLQATQPPGELLYGINLVRAGLVDHIVTHLHTVGLLALGWTILRTCWSSVREYHPTPCQTPFMVSTSHDTARGGAMNHWLAATLITSTTAILGPLAACLVWLAGLRHVLYGAKPSDRPAILRAYAVCQPTRPRGYPVARVDAGDHRRPSATRRTPPRWLNADCRDELFDCRRS
jgi:hypothetical protein